jgi:O-antigen ligase
MGSCDDPPLRHSLAGAPLAVAVAAPTLFAFNLAPSPTLLNQCLAIGLWGLSLAMIGTRVANAARRQELGGSWPLFAALALLSVGVVASAGLAALPASIAIGVTAVLCATLATLWFGHLTARAPDPAMLLIWVFWGLVVAGACSALISCVQVFAPAWPDGDWVARSGLPGRAVGNLRQPNHLSSLLLWAMIATVGLRETRRMHQAAGLILQFSLVFALVLTGSRTGVLGMLLLAAWGLLDRRLSRASRTLLLASPAVFAATWFGLSEWAHATGHAFGAEGRLSLTSGGDISSSRFAIWSNTVVMIANQPLAGVGLGEFNLAWTLSAFPDRPIAFFDHTHNLALQLWVELGVPLGSAVIILLLVALVLTWRHSWWCEGDEGAARRTALMMVLMIGLHSQLEYPLWYAYFLLPTAFAWGFALARPGSRPIALDATGASAPTTTPASSPPRTNRAPAFVGIAMTLGATAAVLDYRQVVAIYDPPDNAAPLEERIARGQHSPLFGHHADYAAATAFGEPKAPLSPSQQLAFRRAPHQLLDVRLMIAWSQALAAEGDLDKARWLAARIKEFRNPQADEYFEPCHDPERAVRAFQCQPPQRVVHWREFTQQR